MRILITGASGLVGQGVLSECLRDARVTSVAALVRRPLDRRDPRLTSLLVERFDALAPVLDHLGGFDACFYCAGAPPVGTAEATYRHVTHDLTLHVATTFAARNPGARFCYISGAHANPASRWMPLRVKGETEVALRALPIITVMLRPGGIQPAQAERSPHRWMRPLYALSGPLMGIGVRLLPGLMTTTTAVGRTLLALAAMPAPPAVVENDMINSIAADGDR